MCRSRGVRQDGFVTDYDVIDFPVFGLANPALHPCWLSIFGPGDISKVGAVTLAHGWLEDRGDRWVDVTTAVRQPTPSDWAAADWDWYNTGLDVLVRSDIDYRSAAGRAWQQASDEFNADYEAHYETWSTHTWMLDGAPVPARSFAIGSHLAALCVDRPDVLIMAHGAGVAPDQLVLTVTTGVEYGLDFRVPLHWPDSAYASRVHAGGKDNRKEIAGAIARIRADQKKSGRTSP
jgi:hypothetical protein